MKLLQVDSVLEVKNKINKYFSDYRLDTEEVDINEALNRYIGEAVVSPIPVPEFNRSVVDGYAVVSRDTYGAGESIPVFLKIIDAVEIGKKVDTRVEPGKAIYIPTGGMLPSGSDSVVMIEYTENLDEKNIAVYSPVAPGDGLINIGDDITIGQQLYNIGKKINYRDIAVLAAVGITKVKVFKKPKMAIISTGDEIIAADSNIEYGQIRDINTHVLAAMAYEAGAEISMKVIVKDDMNLIVDSLKKAVQISDIVIISGGSSQGVKDITESAIASIGEPGVFVHGVAIKPGKPTIVGKADGKAIFGLPGHPGSAIMIFKIFVEHLINNLFKTVKKDINITATCGADIHSSPGKENYQLVEIEETEIGYYAKPIYAKSASVSMLSSSNGFIKIPDNKEGISKGEKVKVQLF